MASGDVQLLIRELLSFRSRLDTQPISIAWEYKPDGSGTQRITWLDVQKWTGTATDPATIPAAAIKPTFGDIAGPFTAEYMQQVSDMNAKIGLANLDAKYWGYIDSNGKLLGSVGGVMVAVSFVDMAYKASQAWESGDHEGAAKLATEWVGGSIGGMVLGAAAFKGAAAVLAPLALLGPVGIGAGVVGTIGSSLLGAYLGYESGHLLGGALADFIASAFTAAQNFALRRDPLVLYLDGDGLETVGAAQSGVVFDLDADGIKTGTGCVVADDGFLVMDRNGNGLIWPISIWGRILSSPSFPIG